MILFKKVNDIHKWIESQREKQKKIGFVPTMGALHQGHISLIDVSTGTNDKTIASIFVNPIQFNDPSDFEKYPVTIEKDIQLLEQAGCDALFLPSVNEIYPQGFPVKQHYDLGYIETILEGEYRPGHFQGVCAVVHRLLTITIPDNLYLGQKDYQQCMVLKKMTEITNLSPVPALNICPTLREDDGLAMSSRNTRLNDDERKKAANIFQALVLLKNTIQPGNLEKLINEGLQNLEEAGFKPDYLVISDAKTLEPVIEWDGKRKIVALTAAYLNEIRLIDNMLLN